MTTQLCQDIETLEDAIINLTEGASDEKRMAIWALERLLKQKQNELVTFEYIASQALADSDGYACNQYTY
jgi:hypothetical protein